MPRLSRNLLFTFLLFLFLLFPSYFSGTNRGIHVVSKKGQSLYLYKDYYAMVVGVSDYEKWPDLPNAARDAKEISTALRQLGFNVQLVSDPTSQELRQAFNDLAFNHGRVQNRALLFYYAGHGETEILADGTKLGYIIPRDCPLLREDPRGFVNQAISMKDIEAYSLRIRSKHLLMLFDSCFSGSLFSLVRAVPEDISEKSALPVRQYITAGTEDEQVPDKSMFKRSLLLGLKGDADLTRDGYITGSELGMYLADKVVKYTRGRQHPQYGKINNPDLDRGDFIFQAKVAETTPEPVVSDDQGQQELTEELARLKAKLESLEKEKPAYATIPNPIKKLCDDLRYGKGLYVIDDFEDKDLWSQTWQDKWRGETRGGASVNISADAARGANGTSSSMKIEYKLPKNSRIFVVIGGRKKNRLREVQKNNNNAYDLSRFRKISFYIRDENTTSSFPRSNWISVVLNCYGEEIKSREGKVANYYQKTKIIPQNKWQRIDVPFDDYVPTPSTKHNVVNYPSKPDLSNVLNIFFLLTSQKGVGGFPDSNTVWIDELILE